jgi:thiamine biosynthesis lipoprotein
MSEGHSVPANAHRFSHEAMATVFEIAMIHDDARYAEQCAQAAFAEVDKLEQDLSCFLPNSDISRINNSEPGSAVVVGPDAFTCLQQCDRLSVDTNGAFDVTMGVMSQLLLYEVSYTVLRLSDSVSIDLGGFGKGYAVDRMAEILDEWDIPAALLHGGSSSVMAMDAPPGESGWRMTLRDPLDRDRVIERLSLERRSISGSGLRKGSHIVDPRTGRPAEDKCAAWVVADDAATGDGLSTALMVMSGGEVQDYCRENNSLFAIVLTEEPGGSGEILRYGDLSGIS